ncbi:hypothetical protein BD324DRAFT_653342 [Kockovaella imperatae]|uniref:Uncharacterized protein n=1 Tax=Kockovaella imperatae TaxID=4999 RepID=A0A1Y1U966_9TREE|nr:hypothetical protein BD324DRAFT_653342 [Kockovaella imperatae]ORX34570.1 hypothetical protein BD324DRAFT_653342 [Kockovaella imperatae]
MISDPSILDDTSRPPPPGSYAFPLVLVIIICAGFLAYRRRQRAETFARDTSYTTRSALRLSTEEGPSAHSFLVNNASTDSLPSHALADLPTLPQVHDGLPPGSRGPEARLHSRSPDQVSAQKSSTRRSIRVRPPIEDDSDSEGESHEPAHGPRQTFSIE